MLLLDCQRRVPPLSSITARSVASHLFIAEPNSVVDWSNASGVVQEKQGALPTILTDYSGYSYFLVPIFFLFNLQPRKNGSVLLTDILQPIGIESKSTLLGLRGKGAGQCRFSVRGKKRSAGNCPPLLDLQQAVLGVPLRFDEAPFSNMTRFEA